MLHLVFDRAMIMFAQATTGAPSPVALTNPAVTTKHYKHTWLHTVLLFIYFLVCLGLVIAVLLQTTKSEGLSGIMGGSAQSVFRGKKGFEETLQEITNYLAVSFVVMSFLVSLFAFKA